MSWVSQLVPKAGNLSHSTKGCPAAMLERRADLEGQQVQLDWIKKVEKVEVKREGGGEREAGDGCHSLGCGGTSHNRPSLRMVIQRRCTTGKRQSHHKECNNQSVQGSHARSALEGTFDLIQEQGNSPACSQRTARHMRIDNAKSDQSSIQIPHRHPKQASDEEVQKEKSRQPTDGEQRSNQDFDDPVQALPRPGQSKYT